MAHRYDSNPFDEEEVNPFSVSPFLSSPRVLLSQSLVLRTGYALFSEFDLVQWCLNRE